MTISQIIKELERLKDEHGDIPVSCDFNYRDTDLMYNSDLDCIFGEEK